MKRYLGWSAALLTVAAAIVFLGGTGYRYLGGAHALDIEGRAPVHDGDPVLPGDGWQHYGNDAGGQRYSSAAQIAVANVGQLELAWQYRTGDASARPEAMQAAISEGTPILVDDALVFCTPFNDIIALDPGSGDERWRFNADVDLDQRPGNEFVCRGVTAWRDTESSGACSTRIFTGTNDSRLIAVDARTGQRCADFGDKGAVVIDPGMDLVWPGEYQITSPPVTIDDIVDGGDTIGEN